MRASILLATVLSAQAIPAYAIDVDGKISPEEYAGAQHVTDFRQMEPETKSPGSQRTEAWILATPKGLAVAFRNYQDKASRTYQRTRRDEPNQQDRNNVFIDFGGDGVGGNEFTVTLSDGITDGTIFNETSFSEDWDGEFQHATSEQDEYWESEFLIPWHIAQSKKATGGKRTIGVYLDRVLGKSGERATWPAITWRRAPFLSAFNKIEVEAHNQSLLAVTPYVTGIYDNVNGKSEFKTGGDLYWKPNGQFQLTATINPDFGQVESDNIVVNFGAQETFFGDKRPFFTENQSIFDFGMLFDNSQLVYTRRVGGASDDGKGLAEIDAALKLNGTMGKFSYGLMAAEERGDAGRSFQVLRGLYAGKTNNIGTMVTHVDRPFLDRSATVVGVDHRYKPNNRWTVVTNAALSNVDHHGVETRGIGGSTLVNYNPNKNWAWQFIGMGFNPDFQINDFGYLGRNNIYYAHFQGQRNWSDLPKGSWAASGNFRARAIVATNDQGQYLDRTARLSTQWSLRDGGSFYTQLDYSAASWDDQLTRGNNRLYTRPATQLYFEYYPGRKGKWKYGFENWNGSTNLPGTRGFNHNVYAELAYYFTDRLSTSFGALHERDSEALIWDQGNTVGRYQLTTSRLTGNLNWDISPRSDLRLKLQALGISGTGKQNINVLPDGGYVVSATPINDFSFKRFGLQVRYRYELAPLSNLYVVYARGGAQDIFNEENGWSLVKDSFRLRDDEQLLVKLSYRFSN